MIKKVSRFVRSRSARPLGKLRKALGRGRIYVNASAPQGGNGRSWHSACRDLADAMHKASPWTEIWIAGGTYKPDRGTRDQEAKFTFKEGFRLLGGFRGGETNAGQRDSAKNPTILTGVIDPDGDPEKSSHHVVAVGWTVRHGLLDSVIIEGGNSERFGGGLMINGSGAGGITVRDCIIRRNSAYAAGGVFCLKSGAVFERCRFEQNTAVVRAGGFYVLSGLPKLIKCEFVGNVSAEGGSALYNIQGDPAVEDCRFVENSCEDEGAAVLSISGRPVFSGCLFERNRSGFGGAYFHDSGFGTIRNCRFVGNEAAQDGGGLFVKNGFPEVENCIFEANRARRGGAIFSLRGRFSPTNCRFGENHAPQGSAIHAEDVARVELKGCQISHDAGVASGRGLVAAGGAGRAG